MEVACDERALAAADDAERKHYGHTLLDLAEWRTVALTPAGAELHFGSTLRARIEALVHVSAWPRAIQGGLVMLAVAGFAACSSMAPTEGTAHGPGSIRAAQAGAWTAPLRELQSDEDLVSYCSPLVESAQSNAPDPRYSQLRYRQPVPDGLPAEQVTFCTSPAVRDLVIARNWVTEARNALAQILKDTATYYEQSAYPSGRYELCPSGPPVPRVMPAPDTKYRPKWPQDWNDGAGWQCLRFGMDQPFWFQYEYISDGQHVRATAHGRRTNYRGEVIDASLALTGDIVGGNHVFNIAPNIQETWVSVP
jgi:hypothetical protein